MHEGGGVSKEYFFLWIKSIINFWQQVLRLVVCLNTGIQFLPKSGKICSPIRFHTAIYALGCR